MATFRQRIPNFVSGVEPAEFAFANREELLAHPCVEAWAKDNFTGRGPFHKFSVSVDASPLLMAEYDGGKHWWVVGFIDDASGLDLPACCPPD